MWTRFVGNTEGYEVQLHADAPAQDDVVIVTDEKVVRALLDGSLEFAKAEAYGLLRLYGETGQQSAVRTMLAGVARPSATSPADAKHVMPEKATPQREQ